MNSFFLGGDASKGYCDFILLDQNERVIEDNFQLDDCYEGHQALCAFLDNFFSNQPYAVVYTGFESTGGFETNWYQLIWKLQDRLDIKVARVNPFAVKHHKKASLSRIETDKISALKIAQYLVKYPENVDYCKEDYFSGTRRYWKYIRMLKKQKAQLQTTLKAQLYVAHPQLLSYCTDGISDWVLLLLNEYPTAARLASATPQKISEIPRISQELATQLVMEAKKSVASMQDYSMENLVKSAAETIYSLKKTIEQQVKLMSNTYAFPEVELLLSITGINLYSAFGLLIEIGAIERYPSVKELAAFFGLHPKWRESGDGTWGMHMSKQGRKEPRWILFNVAKCAVAKDEMMKELYEKYQAMGKCKMSALGIIMHKILRIIYGMLKRKSKFEPGIDKAYRERATQKIQAPALKTSKNRRYQKYDSNAPISRRQRKKRNQNEQQKRGNQSKKMELDAHPNGIAIIPG